MYTDGACAGNGNKNATGGMGVWFGVNDPRNKSQRLTDTTNNRAEYGAILCALDIEPLANMLVITDSKLACDTFTTWIHNWKRNGWKTSSGQPVKNEDLVRQIDQKCESRAVVFLHTLRDACLGNKEADALSRR